MKKILHISKFYSPYFGGIEDVANVLVRELSGLYEQKIICFNHESRSVVDVVEGVEVWRVNASWVIASQPISFSYRRILRQLIGEFRPDFIHLHLPNPLVASMLLTMDLHEAKIISHWHADILGQKWIYPFYRKLEKRLLQRSEKIIVTSRMYMEASSCLRPFVNKTAVLPNPVNEEKFQLTADDIQCVEKIKQHYGGKKIVFFVGRHVPYKGIEYLIEAEPFVADDCVIVIAGSGELSAKLKAMASGNERIKFVGRLSNEELKCYLYAATVFAFPSITRQEAFGVALAEALYCGLPAVSFHVAGSGALWVNKDRHTGIVVEEQSAKAYADALNEILASDELRHLYSENARKWVKQHFMKEQIVPIMQGIYC